MSNRWPIQAVILAAMVLAPVVAPAQDAEAILRRMESALFPDNYRMRMSMITTQPGRDDREMVLSAQYRRGIGTYMEIEAPARSRGTRLLQREETLWMFTPRSNARTPIRLAARDSFQGSVFSNRDIGESMYSEDYRAAVAGREWLERADVGRVEVYVIELTPRRDEAAYGRIVAWVTADEHIPLRMQYFVRSGMNTKEMVLSELRQIAGRRRPVLMEMSSLEERGKVTTVRILELESDEAIPDRVFTTQYLTR